jgi:hypothetical protein
VLTTAPGEKSDSRKPRVDFRGRVIPLCGSQLVKMPVYVRVIGGAESLNIPPGVGSSG